MNLSQNIAKISKLTAAAIFLGVFAVLPPAAAQIAAERGHAPVFPALIKVEAGGTATAKPDMALLQISVSHEAKTAKAALEQTGDALQTVLAALKKNAIADKDMQTDGVSVSPVYRAETEKSKKEKSFQATAQLAIKIRDSAAVGRVMDAVIANGATGLSDLVWTNSDVKPLYKQAREKALANALEKAKTYAQAAGIATGRILRIEESSDNFASPRLYARAANSAVMIDAPTPTAEGEKDYTVQISLTMELLNKTEN